jgi:hypothetical protein
MHFLHIAVISLGLACTSFALPRRNNGTQHACRTLPGDANWPSARSWQAFNDTVNGRLIATAPLAQPCHDDFYDAETCDNLKSEWDLPWIQYGQSLEKLATINQRLTTSQLTGPFINRPALVPKWHMRSIQTRFSKMRIGKSCFLLGEPQQCSRCASLARICREEKSPSGHQEHRT